MTPYKSDINDHGADLHARLIAGDEVASSAVAELFLPVLVSALMRKYPNLPDPALVEQACIDTLMVYLAAPQKYDPSRGLLLTYLWRSADGDLLNLLAKQRRRGKHETAMDDVELVLPSRNIQILGSVDDPEIEFNPKPSPLVHAAMNLLKTDEDRTVLSLLMEGVRATGKFAEVLKVSHLSALEQVSIVKKHKDRIKKTVQRGLSKAGKGRQK